MVVRVNVEAAQRQTLGRQTTHLFEHVGVGWLIMHIVKNKSAEISEGVEQSGKIRTNDVVERCINAAAIGQGADARDDVFLSVVDDAIDPGLSRICFSFSGANADFTANDTQSANVSVPPTGLHLSQ